VFLNKTHTNLISELQVTDGLKLTDQKIQNPGRKQFKLSTAFKL